jgi:2-C-methyl-D-erythritol 4-phosphate cytidylyltransferase/2-C-methyl-D-erythritol 2,4-cyclodiphosphate synthase
MKLGVVIVCAGLGKRLGGKNKANIKLGPEPLFLKSLKTFQAISAVKEIVLVFRHKLAKDLVGDSRVSLVSGGRRRQDSVLNGLRALSKDIDYVLVHDGARPLIEKKIILQLIKALKNHPAVIVASESTNTLKLVEKGWIRKTLPRDKIFQAQTPQGFKKALLLKAYQKFKQRNLTDDAGAVELLGQKVGIVKGSSYNLKITYPQDLAIARALIGRGDCQIGFGFDVHRIIKAKKPLVLGGVTISSLYSLKAVSDGDVILHAACDALCGSANLGDIGDYFPPAKTKKGIDSKNIVDFILKKIGSKYEIVNLDIVIVSDKPRLLKHKKVILKSLKKIFKILSVNLKIKSKEKLAILGAKNSMSCLALAVLKTK